MQKGAPITIAEKYKASKASRTSLRSVNACQSFLDLGPLLSPTHLLLYLPSRLWFHRLKKFKADRYVLDGNELLF